MQLIINALYKTFLNIKNHQFEVLLSDEGITDG